MHTKFRWENLKEKRPLGDVGVDEGKRAWSILRNFLWNLPGATKENYKRLRS
jgi:hypothetical protein